jgi:hypothetical protein
MKDRAIAFLVKRLLGQSPLRGKMNEEQYKMAMSKMHQNPALTQYFDEREEHLIHTGMEQFAVGKLESAQHYAGQLFELRTLRNRARACYTSLHRKS